MATTRAVKVFLVLLVLLLLFAGYLWAALSWSYSNGERAGWVQKFSRKGWLCKTWEGEMAMVSMPGAMPEKFYFTVHDDTVAHEINSIVGRRVSLTYEYKVGLPTSCFGDTRYFITAVHAVEEMPFGPGAVSPYPTRPGPQQTPDQAPQQAPQQTPPQPAEQGAPETPPTS